MEIKFNDNFKKLVGRNFAIGSISSCAQDISLKDSEDIVEIEGCFYFKKFAPEGKLSGTLNKMEYEYDTNCLRVDDLTNKRITNTQAFWCGLFLIKELINRLQNSFGNGFEVILTYDYRHCYIRFYKIRKGINNVMSSDLEGFKREVILKIVI